MINKSQQKILIAVAAILSIPLVAMQITNEVNWSLTDFIIMGILLTITGFSCEYIYRSIPNKKHKFAVIAGILILLVLIWIELAVGIFNSPFAGS